MTTLILLSLLACGGGQSPTPEGALHGTPPAEARPALEFQVANQLGEARTRADLVGQPTVLWFYPMAGTPG